MILLSSVINLQEIATIVPLKEQLKSIIIVLHISALITFPS